jgi:predicted porin
MKKTLIAAGIAAVIAAPAAMADVQVSGQLKVFQVVSENGNDTWLSDNSITFKSSEDLGNGLTAFGQATIDLDSSDSAQTVGSNKDMKLGLKGSFGTFVAGRMESLTEGVQSGKFDDGRSKHSGDAMQLESPITNLDRVNALAYISPTVNGIHAAIAFADASATSAGTSANSFNDSSNTGMFDAGVDMLVAYDNGPLNITATRFNSEAANSDIDAISASYKMGDATVKVGYFDKDNGADDSIISLSYDMGNNNLLIGYRDGKDSSGYDHDVLALKITHKLSKKTGVWAGYRATSDGTSASASTDADVAHWGMYHKF